MAGGAEARRRKRIQHMIEARLVVLEAAVKELQSGQQHMTVPIDSLGPSHSAPGISVLEEKEEHASPGECPSSPCEDAKEPMAEQQPSTSGEPQRTGSDLREPPPASGALEGSSTKRPEEKQQSQQSQAHSDSCSVHTLAITLATSRKHSERQGCAALALSFVFVLAEVILLGGTMLESSFRRCGEHGDCHAGEWCSPALFAPFTTSPGVCFDCWSALHLHDARFGNATYETAPDPYERMAESAGDTWLQEGYLHCVQTDLKPRACDFIKKNRSRMSGFNFSVLLAVAVFIMAPVAEDLDEVSVHESFAKRRLEGMPNKMHRRWTQVTLWFLTRLRLFVLPLFIVSASLGLILTLELTSYNLLLNGFAITFMTTLDDMLESLLIHPSSQREGISVVCPMDLWLFNRVYALVLGAALVVTILEASWLMPFIGNEAKWGSPCSDLREVATFLPAYITLGASFVRPLFHQVSTKGRALWRDPKGLVWAVGDAAATPAIVWLFVELTTGQYFLLKMQAGDWV